MLSPDPVVARRVRVLLATGVLAFSAGVTATSVASEPDDQREGVFVPEQGPPPPAESEGGDDLGPDSGGDTPLPFELDPVPDGSEPVAPRDGSDETAPLEAEPVDDPDGRLPLTDPALPDDLDAQDTPVPPSGLAPPVTLAPPAQPPLDPNADSAPSADPPSATKPDRSPRRTRQPRQRRGEAKRNLRRDTTPVEPVPDAPAPAAPVPPVPVPADAVEQGGAVTAVARVSTDLRGRRFHVVRSGESLWSIASAVVGPGATAGAIAIEVRRLWRLNRNRIGTGDPDLLIAGVKLRLR